MAIGSVRARFFWTERLLTTAATVLMLGGVFHPSPALAHHPPRTSATGPWARLEQRRLHLPRLRPSAPCLSSPARVAHTFSPFGTAFALGTGPAYPLGFDAQGVLHERHVRPQHGWRYYKILWFVRPSYRGPVLVRGRQIDGPHLLRFDSTDSFTDADFESGTELRLLANGNNPGGWSAQPTDTQAQSTGCYAYQIDGQGFSKVLVFRVAP